MSRILRCLGGLVLATSLAAGPHAAFASEPPDTCPGASAVHSDHDNARACYQAAKRLRDPRARAPWVKDLVMFARRAYESDRSRLNGQDLVLSATEFWRDAEHLEPQTADAMLAECEALLSMRRDDLAGDPEAAGAIVKRLRQVQNLRNSRNPSALRLTLPDVATNGPAEVPPPAATPEEDRVSRRPLPRGLLAGIGLGGAGLIVSAAFFGDSAASGNIALTALNSQGVNDTACGERDAPSGCRDLERARVGYVASAVGMGFAAATVTIFAALLISRRVQGKRPIAFATPHRGGAVAGFALRF